MKGFKLAVIATCFLSGMAVCRANLGETEAQCIARYGQEFDVQENLGFDVAGDKAASFNLKTAKGPLVMHVIFLNGVAGMEKITSADSSVDISDEQLQGILSAEGAGLKWSRQSTNYRTDRSDYTSEKQQWKRSDGADAICWASGKTSFQHGWGEIDISSRGYEAAQREVDRQGGA